MDVMFTPLAETQARFAEIRDAFDAEPEVWKKQFCTVEEMLRLVLEEKLQLWALGNGQKVVGWVISSVTAPLPHRLCVHAWVGQNVLSAWDDFVAAMLKAAIIFECRQIVILTSRRGLGKYLEGSGFKPTAIEYVREVTQ